MFLKITLKQNLNKTIKYFSVSDVFSKCKGDLLEVKDGNLKTHPTLLENLVFFVEVCFVFFLKNSIFLKCMQD